ncbi:DUF3293 domain-containing protein [Roseomonas stagni]|uniref:DUF3293 domain-containing protein n=1 Tax=Falsiroseomonas algicola TaxID=2716930 RepID=A0A6M1LIJ6_9PROT|nr:DUF3293 domain-containing protein [Falsiroseomonas algicola]NGM20155.1 DUF3293 domain-containing protein [Falsiroseomonas algicola]
MRAVRATLIRAFRATTFEAEGAVARIGRRSRALDALLRGPAAFITAWNPYSRPMPFGWNDRMQGRLRQAVAGRVIGEGWGRGSGWAEHHLLVAGAPARLRVVARRFRQHAIVIVAPGRPARLLAA